MNVADFDNCKELHELSGWLNDHPSQAIWVEYADDTQMLWASPTPDHTEEVLQTIPAYDLGYLLRKLPTDIEEAQFVNIGTGDAQGPWVAEYSPALNVQTIYAFADTPEDAAAKLCIELFKQGILNNDKGGE